MVRGTDDDFHSDPVPDERTPEINIRLFLFALKTAGDTLIHDLDLDEPLTEEIRQRYRRFLAAIEHTVRTPGEEADRD